MKVCAPRSVSSSNDSAPTIPAMTDAEKLRAKLNREKALRKRTIVGLPNTASSSKDSVPVVSSDRLLTEFNSGSSVSLDSCTLPSINNSEPRPPDFSNRDYDVNGISAEIEDAEKEFLSIISSIEKDRIAADYHRNKRLGTLYRQRDVLRRFLRKVPVQIPQVESIPSRSPVPAMNFMDFHPTPGFGSDASSSSTSIPITASTPEKATEVPSSLHLTQPSLLFTSASSLFSSHDSTSETDDFPALPCISYLTPSTCKT